MWWTRNDIREGMLVTSVAGQRLGKVIRCDDETFIIEKGVFFPKDYELRYDHITDVADGTINYLLSDENTLRGSETKIAAGGGAAARLKDAVHGGREPRQERREERREERQEERHEEPREERQDAQAEQPIAAEPREDRWADRDDGLEEERLTSGGEREGPIQEPVGREGQPNAEEARAEATRAGAIPDDDDMIAGEEISIYREEVVVRTVPQSAQPKAEDDEHPPAPRTPPAGQGPRAPSMR